MKLIELKIVFVVPDNLAHPDKSIQDLVDIMAKWVKDNIPPMATDMPENKVTVTIQDYPRKETHNETES